MKNSRLAIAFALAPGLLAGCRGAPDPVAFAPTVPQPSIGMAQWKGGWAPGEGPVVSEPLVEIEIEVFSAPPDAVARIEGIRNAAVQVIPRAAAEALSRGKADGTVEKVQACKIGLSSGRPGSWTGSLQMSYIQDIAIAGGAGGMVAKPIVGVLETGASAEAEAKVEGAGAGAGIVLGHFDIQAMRLLGMRRVSARLPVAGGAVDAWWQEPVVLSARLESWQAPVRMKSGDFILARLAFSVRQGCSNARGYAPGGAVAESYEPRGTSRQREEIPLARAYYAVATVRVLPARGAVPGVPAAPPDVKG